MSFYKIADKEEKVLKWLHSFRLAVEYGDLVDALFDGLAGKFKAFSPEENQLVDLCRNKGLEYSAMRLLPENHREDLFIHVCFRRYLTEINSIDFDNIDKLKCSKLFTHSEWTLLSTAMKTLYKQYYGGDSMYQMLTNPENMAKFRNTTVYPTDMLVLRGATYEFLLGFFTFGKVKN